MLVERLERDDVPVWLVNTGWTGGPYGTGERMNIAHTRSMVRAALDGALDDVPTRIDPNFGVEVPTALPGRAGRRSSTPARRGPTRTPTTVPRPSSAQMFRDNFAAYADGLDAAVAAAGPGGAPD